VLGKRQKNPASNGERLAAPEMQKRREGVAEYGAQADDNNQQFRKSEVIVGEKDKGEPLANVKGNGNRSGLYVAGPEDIYCAGIAITVFPDIFV